ncbi:MAG: Hpt domain-containing protein [Pirellulales bacterium]|nr:Hpt domain-containing protein [Pirellulales bacterium]
MIPATSDLSPLYSSLSSDPDLGGIVAIFVEEMPDRVAAIERAFEGADWDLVQRLAHQMKGAAGSYGFDQITPSALRLEFAARARNDHLELQSALAEFVGMCQRIRFGGPER